MWCFFMVYQLIAFLCVVALFLVREYVNYKERKDLLNRLMSRDFEQFKHLTETPEPNNFGDEDDNLINIEEAREELV